MITKDFPVDKGTRKIAAGRTECLLTRLRGMGYSIAPMFKKPNEGEFILDSLPGGGFRVIIEPKPNHKEEML